MSYRALNSSGYKPQIRARSRVMMDKRTKSQPFSVCKITDLFSQYISAYENAFFR